MNATQIQRKTLLLDNYDSFTYNLYQYLGELGGNPIVKRNDEITLEEIDELSPTHIVISPGPGRPENPEDFGICQEVIKNFHQTTPILGVCLGHQGLAHFFGAKIVNAPEVMHGKKSKITHTQQGLFQDLPENLKVMRYHSLIVDRDSLPSELVVNATTTEDGLIMAFQHQTLPLYGIQFHPESIGTPHGKKMIENFLKN